jgi:AraC-like DNA-binding protein
MVLPTLSLRSYAPVAIAHAHDWHQIVLPLEGAHAMELDRDRATIEGRRAALIGADRTHRFQGLGENLSLVLDVPREATRSWALPERLLRAASATPFFEMDEGLQRFGAYARFALTDGALDEADAHLLSQLLMRALAKRLAPTPTPVARAMALIETAGAVRVEEMARAAGLSVSAFLARFKAETGATPMAAAIDARLAKAERLLKTTATSIAEIAHETGFSDQSALTRSFRRRRGTTPGRLRKH